MRRLIATPLCAGVVAAAVGSGAVALTHAGAVTASGATPSTLTATTKLYREYCGQCHALSQALSAGFGSNSNGLGSNGGPSFNDLRVPYELSIAAIAEPTGGHETVKRRVSWKQLTEIAAYVAKVTAHNPILATPTDG